MSAKLAPLMSVHADQLEMGAEVDGRTRELLTAYSENVTLLSEAFVAWERLAGGDN